MGLHCIYCFATASINPLIWVSEKSEDEQEKVRHREFCEEHEKCGPKAVGGIIEIKGKGDPIVG